MLISKGLLGDQLSIFLENLHYKSKHIFDSIVHLLKKKTECAQNLISIFHLLKKIGKTEDMKNLNFYSEAILK